MKGSMSACTNALALFVPALPSLFSLHCSSGETVTSVTSMSPLQPKKVKKRKETAELPPAIPEKGMRMEMQREFKAGHTEEGELCVWCKCTASSREGKELEDFCVSYHKRPALKSCVDPGFCIQTVSFAYQILESYIFFPIHKPYASL